MLTEADVSPYVICYVTLPSAIRCPRNMMGNAITWMDDGAANLPCARVSTSDDQILGVDQTGAAFFQAVFDQFCAYEPSISKSKQYNYWGLCATKSKW